MRNYAFVSPAACTASLKTTAVVNYWQRRGLATLTQGSHSALSRHRANLSTLATDASRLLPCLTGGLGRSYSLTLKSRFIPGVCPTFPSRSLLSGFSRLPVFGAGPGRVLRSENLGTLPR
jgi:hypothetical protein